MTIEHRFELHGSTHPWYFSVNICTVFDTGLGIHGCCRPSTCINLCNSRGHLSIHGFWYRGTGHGDSVLEPIFLRIPRDNQVFGKWKVIHKFSAAQRSAPMTPTLFKGQLYLISYGNFPMGEKNILTSPHCLSLVFQIKSLNFHSRFPIDLLI